MKMITPARGNHSGGLWLWHTREAKIVTPGRGLRGPYCPQGGQGRLVHARACPWGSGEPPMGPKTRVWAILAYFRDITGACRPGWGLRRGLTKGALLATGRVRGALHLWAQARGRQRRREGDSAGERATAQARGRQRACPPPLCFLSFSVGNQQVQ